MVLSFTDRRYGCVRCLRKGKTEVDIKAERDL